MTTALTPPAPVSRGGGVGPRASPVGLEGDRALQADRGAQEPVDHEESVHGPQARRGHGCQGAQAHEGGVQSREERDAGQEQEGEARLGKGGDRRTRAWFS